VSVAGILVAAGRGERLDAAANTPKALVTLAGVPLVVHAIRRLTAGGVRALVVVHPVGQYDAFTRALSDAGVETAGLTLVPGGAERTDSVRAGLAACPATASVIAVHDAARPLTPSAVVRAAVGAVLARQEVLAAAPFLTVADTLKRVEDGGRSDGSVEVLATVAREGLVAVQTPQVFRREVLEQAVGSGDGATDELALVERLRTSGDLVGRIVLVPGSVAATKLTRRADLVLLEALHAAGVGSL
jgi:2-C-methyl-D-erythritol 4-phosphate cytidylyltransferase